jgi:hypothetical protein
MGKSVTLRVIRVIFFIVRAFRWVKDVILVTPAVLRFVLLYIFVVFGRLPAGWRV